METELRCNNVQCRKGLGNNARACVTTCSHIFCVECAEKAFNTALICPACESSLTERDDIVFTELNPSEDYKSSVLAGLRPEVIIEIAGRGLSFWVYQTTQEACFQEMIYKNLSEKYSQLERQVQSIVREANQEIQGLREKLGALQKAQEVEKLRNHELAEQYAEKGRQFQKLQLMYDKLKRRSISQQTPTEVGNLEVASSMGPIQGFALGAQSYSLQGDMCQPASGAFQRAPSQPLHQQPQLQRRPFTQLMNNHLPNGKGTQSGFVRPQPGLNGLGTTHPGISRPLMQSRSMDGMQMPHPSGRPRTPSISRIENQYAGFGGGPGSANRGRQSGAHQRHHSMQGM